MKDSSNATSPRVLDCQHLASSKFAPSLDVKTLTSPGAYAQSTFKPHATRREFRTPVHVTPCCIASSCRLRGRARGRARSPETKSNVFGTWAALPGPTYIASQPRALTRCLATTGTPSPETHNHHRLQRCPSACLLCASSQIHWRGLAAQQRLGNLPDCLLNTCCSRWRRQMPHTAAAQLLPMPTISTSGLPINTLAGDSSWQIVYNSGRKTNDKPAAPPKHPLRMQRQCGATTALCCMQLPGHFVRDV